MREVSMIFGRRHAHVEIDQKMKQNPKRAFERLVAFRPVKVGFCTEFYDRRRSIAGQLVGSRKRLSETESRLFPGAWSQFQQASGQVGPATQQPRLKSQE